MREILAGIFLASCSACGTMKSEPPVSLVAGADAVKMYRRDDPPSVCRELGPVKAISGVAGSACVLGSVENAAVKLRNAVIEMGGNALLVGKATEPEFIDPSGLCMSDHDLTFKAEGIAFDCPVGASE